MKLQQICLSVFIFISALSVCLGQNEPETVEGENWVQQYGLYPMPLMVFRYDRYSREDTVKFREKLDLLKSAKFADEWEGSYVRDIEELGMSSFRWDSNAGFVDFYIYTCFPELRYLNYGKVAHAPEFIQIIPEFAADSLRKSIPVKYVKVKWEKRHYLVEESSLLAFAEKAAGIYVEPEDESSEKSGNWMNYWVKGDLEQDLKGLPEFPARYKRFQRSPIEAKIVSVGKRTIESEVEIGGSFHTDETAVYRVTIGAGANKGIKKGMNLYSDELNEVISIIQVNQNSAVGVIGRAIDENKNDHCLDDEANKIPCPTIKPALKVKSRVGKFWY